MSVSIKKLQINATYGKGSTGAIVKDILNLKDKFIVLGPASKWFQPINKSILIM